jgi:hypothetical protein
MLAYLPGASIIRLEGIARDAFSLQTDVGPYIIEYISVGEYGSDSKSIIFLLDLSAFIPRSAHDERHPVDKHRGRRRRCGSSEISCHMLHYLLYSTCNFVSARVLKTILAHHGAVHG